MKNSDDLEWSASADGYIFMGLEPATEEDFAALNSYAGGEALYQESSICGRYDRAWTATGNADMGGEGSHTYETQKVGAAGGGDVEFRPLDDDDAVFHFNPEGEYVSGILMYDKTLGAYHTTPAGVVCGPKPDTLAEELLGDGEYRWNEKNRWYVIR